MCSLWGRTVNKIEVNITASQRGLCSKTASKATSGFAKTFAWFLVAETLKGFALCFAPKCTKVPFYLNPETQKWGNAVPAVLRFSLAVTPSHPGSWAKSTVLLTDQITNTQRYLGVNTHQWRFIGIKSKMESPFAWWRLAGLKIQKYLSFALRKKVSFLFFFFFLIQCSKRSTKVRKERKSLQPGER